MHVASPDVTENAHKPWKGRLYKEGIEGVKIAIVGFSHYVTKRSHDVPGLTSEVLGLVVAGKLRRNSFFPAVPPYFGFDDPAVFWSRVAFFNFLPNAVGMMNQRYKPGTAAQLLEAKSRFLETLQRLQPDCTFVFTTKGWRACPQTVEESAGRSRRRLRCSPTFTWGTYKLRGHELPVFGLRHPQGAPAQTMTRAVKEALQLAEACRS